MEPDGYFDTLFLKQQSLKDVSTTVHRVVANMGVGDWELKEFVYINRKYFY